MEHEKTEVGPRASDNNDQQGRRLAQMTAILALAAVAENSILELIEKIKEVYRNELCQ